MKKEINRNQQLMVNMSASFVAYGVSLFISFFLSPYIVSTIGVEANGFVGLANNFVSYASIITIALNSLAGRFITISIYEKNYNKANEYFSSVYYANLCIAMILAVIGGFVIVFLERLINIPLDIVRDVKLLFICLFLNCIISIVGSVFSVATFAMNKLYLESIRNIEANLARALIIIGLFALFAPRVSYIGAGSLISGVYILIRNIHYTHVLLPYIRISRKHFNVKAVIELITSGIWNTINRLGQLLLDGLDLLITNIFIDSTAMGIMSLSKTLPSLVSGVLSSLVGVFSPDFTILYAEGKREELIFSIKRSMKIMGIMMNLLIIVLLVCGKEFFALWQPTQDATALYSLFVLNIGCLIFSGGINCLYGIFTVVNKVKVNSLVVVGCGFISTVLVLFLLKTTDLGIFAISGVSTVVSIARNLVFTVPYGAYCLNLKWYTFYPDVFKPVFFALVGTTLGMLLGQVFDATTWWLWFLKAAFIGMIALIVGLFIVLNKGERKYIYSMIRSIPVK